MNRLIKYCLTLSVLIGMASCADPDKYPYPDFEAGVNLRVLPNPFTLRPQFDLASINSSSIVYSFSSANASELQKVDVFVSRLTATQSNAVGKIPAAAVSPVTINYAAYAALVAAATPVPKVLLRTLTTFDGDQTFTAAELATATGVDVATLTADQSFILTFLVTKNDGTTFDYSNSGPGITANPAPSASEGADFIPGVIIRVK